jgi:hypothetical protein
MDPIFLAQVEAGLRAMGYHADANETVMFSRSLLQIKEQTYDVLYGDLKARTIFPTDGSISPGATQYAYRQFDHVGEAKLIHDYAKDFPNVDVKGKEFILPLASFGDSYQYSLQDLRSAAFAGVPLDSMKAAAARLAIERKFESICAYGVPGKNVPGFAANPDTLSIPETTHTGTDWTSGTIANILADVNAMSKKVFDQTKGVFQADTLLLGTVEYSAASTRLVAEAYASNVTIAKYILQASPWVKSIVHWPALDNADGGTTLGGSGASRKFMIKRDPMVLSAVVAQEFEQFAPQQQGMAFVVPCHMRAGGVRVTYPLACTFMDLT